MVTVVAAILLLFYSKLRFLIRYRKFIECLPAILDSHDAYTVREANALIISLIPSHEQYIRVAAESTMAAACSLPRLAISLYATQLFSV